MAAAESRRLPMLAAVLDATPVVLPISAPAGRYLVETWGCQMNSYDSERLAGLLHGLGYTRADGEGDADVIVLNTCSVREKAEEKLFSRLGRLRTLKAENPDLLVGVAGCVAQQEQERILGRSGVVDFILGPGAVAGLPDLLRRAAAGERAIDVSWHEGRYDEVWPVVRGERLRAYVTVMEGCNKSCSFCVVPFTRGREVHRSPQAIETEVRQAVAAGTLEVQLLGQNVNAYHHGETDFAALLERVDAIAGLERIRFTTSHPRELSDRVIDAMARCARVCNHIHLPVQSGSDSVLKRMYRGYDRERYLSRVSRLRQRIPDVALSTDIIVGFPGESEDEFHQTMRLLDEVEFDQVFAFLYSPRPNTAAADLDDPTPPAVKDERLQRLFARQDAITLGKHRALLGREVDVLVTGLSRSGAMRSGRTRENHIVNFPAAEEGGPRALVRLLRAMPHSLGGELVAWV